jgi:hypothetical protein
MSSPLSQCKGGWVKLKSNQRLSTLDEWLGIQTRISLICKGVENLRPLWGWLLVKTKQQNCFLSRLSSLPGRDCKYGIWLLKEEKSDYQRSSQYKRNGDAIKLKCRLRVKKSNCLVELRGGESNINFITYAFTFMDYKM